MDSVVAGNAYVIVGGTAGIGLASAEALATQGANVVLVGRSRERAEAAAESLGAKYGVRSVAVPGDASSSREEADRFIAEALAAVGPIAGLAVTTGTTPHARRPLEAMSDADWTSAFEDVLMGTVRSCQAILPHLIDRGSGSIVTTAAYSVRAPDRAAVPYSTLKAAVAVFTKGLARTYGAQGIQANCICPGAVETETLHEMRGQLAKEKGIPYEEAIERVMIEDWGLDTSMRRPGQPHEIGELVAFLLSQRAGYLTGALVNIDGGTNF